MFGLGISEIVVILVIALIVLGPDRMPENLSELGRLWVPILTTLLWS